MHPWLNTMSPGPRPTSVPSGIFHPAVWLQQTWAKNWGNMPLLWGRAGSPSNTMWLVPRPIDMRSFILIHPTVLATIHQRYRQRDRHTGQDRQTDRTMVRYHRANRFRNGRPKIMPKNYKCLNLKVHF